MTPTQNPEVVDCVPRLTRPFTKLINKRAYAMGGDAYFESCRSYLIRRIEARLRTGADLPENWFEHLLLTASVDDMMQQGLPTV